MSLHGSNHYELLGVDSTATPDQIKRAWARLVRQYTPDSDPEANRRLNEAKSVLLDETARADYDAMLDYGEEIEDLLDIALDAQMDEDWGRAEMAYREVLAMHPRDHSARNQLAICLGRGGKLDAAAQQFRRLTREAPGVALYWRNLGQCLDELAASTKLEEDLDRSALAYRKAFEIEPHNASTAMLLSRHWRDRGQFDLAEEYIEKAIQADRQVDLEDLDALLELPLIYLRSGHLWKLDSWIERIRELGKAEGETGISYAGSRVLSFANLLLKANRFDECLTFVRAARKLGADPSKCQTLQTSAKDCKAIQAESEKLADDLAVWEPIRYLGLIAADEALDQSDEDLEQAKENCLQVALLGNEHVVREAVQALKQRYTALYQLNASMFDSIERQVASRAKVSRTRSRATSAVNSAVETANEGCSCLVTILNLFQYLAILVIIIYAVGSCLAGIGK